MISLTAQITTLVATYRYPALIPLAIVGGPLAAIFVGFLAANDVFNIFIAYFIFVLGDIIPDALYYCIGRMGKKEDALEKVTNMFGLSGHHKTIKFLWYNHGRKTMFFGKLAWGLSTPILITAGLVKLPFKTFINYAVPVTLGQYAVFMALGYYFGQEYRALSKYVSYAEYLTTAAIIIFIIGYFFVNKRLKKYIKKLDTD